MYSCKKPSEAIKKVWFTLKYLLNSAIGGNKLWKFPVIVKLNIKKKGLDKKNGKFAFVQNLRNYLQHGHIMQGSIHDASGGVGVGGLVMETLDDMQFSRSSPRLIRQRQVDIDQWRLSLMLRPPCGTPEIPLSKSYFRI